MQRSLIFEVMGHTSVFPIDENKVAEAGILLSQQKKSAVDSLLGDDESVK